ncbi:MAG: chemotaxis protein CheA [Candidatus Ozemobacteraceae bacterium]
MTDNFAESFRPEAQRLLSEFDNGILELEEHPDDIALVEPVFRALHTIKGSCNFLGFTDVGKFAHEIEAAFDYVRKRQMTYSKKFSKIVITAQAQLRQMIAARFGGTPVDEREIAETLSRLKVLADAQREKSKKRAKKIIEDEIAALLPNLQKFIEHPADWQIAKVCEADLGLLYDAADVLGTDLAMFIAKFRMAFTIISTGELPLSPELPQLTIEALEFFPAMVESSELDLQSADIDPVALLESMQRPIDIFARLNEIALKDGFSLEEKISVSLVPSIPQNPEQIWRVVFVPTAGFAQTGLTFGDLEQELGKLGKIAPPPEPQESEGFGRLEVLLTSSQDRSIIADVFGFADGMGELKIDLVEETAESDGTLQGNSKIQEQENEEFAFMRVSLSRLTELVNLIGELVAQNARLLQRASELDESEIVSLSGDLGHLVEKLREGTMLNRMKPIGDTFIKYDGLVKNLSRDLGKQIELVLEGCDTELDMATLDKLNDPLVHLIRNTVDHGIEKPDIRLAAGKPACGKVRLSAEQTGDSVFIRCSDDGAGIDPDRVLKKAIEKGLVKPDVQLKRQEIFDIIFQPGFSTATVVTSVSGRGTGTDVVKRTVEAMHGTISIDSEVGKGSTFTLKLPLTLAILEGLLVRVGERLFVFPLMAVEEIVNLAQKASSADEEQNLAMVRDRTIPYIRLRHLFGEQRVNESDLEYLVICNVDGRPTGFVVDHVIGEHHTLVKNMGSLYRNNRLFSGVTLLGDGRVAFILDINFIAQNQKERQHGGSRPNPAMNSATVQ